MKSEIYLDHAATSYPKPTEVMEAVLEWSSRLGASAGRGDYPRAVETGEMIRRCRHELAGLFNAPDPGRVIFTANCTDALNLALRGLRLKAGDRVIVGPTEHNSVMRPLNAMTREIGIEIVRLNADGEGFVDPAELTRRIDARTRLVSVQHASNVLGALQDIAAIGGVCREARIPLLVDAAQTAGSVPIDMQAMKIDLLAAPGHKALQGPLGTGVLFIDAGIDLDSWRTGGTGSASEEEWQPDFYPDRLESGSHNAPGLAGLLAAVRWVRRRTVEAIRAHEVELIRAFHDATARENRLRVLGPSKPERRAAVVSIAAASSSPSEIAERLWRDYSIMVRPGLHCAPGAHRLSGTFPRGALRFSFGPFTTREDVLTAADAVSDILRPHEPTEASEPGRLVRA